MFIPIWLFIAYAAGQDYASEVLYPDDLIPAEDREGSINLNFRVLTFLQIMLMDQLQFQLQRRLLQQPLKMINLMFAKVKIISLLSESKYF